MGMTGQLCKMQRLGAGSRTGLHRGCIVRCCLSWLPHRYPLTLTPGARYGRQPRTKRKHRSNPRDTTKTQDNPQHMGHSVEPEVVACYGTNSSSSKDLVDGLDYIDSTFLASFGYQANSLPDGTLSETLQSNDSAPEFTLEPIDFDFQTVRPDLDAAVNNYHTPNPLADQLIIVRALGTLSALLLNGAILQIDCHKETHTRDIYIPHTLSAPSALKPTALQTVTPHLPYVDLIPFPTVRDKLLQSQHMISAVEIWGDITRDVTVWGKTLWDEKAGR